jgi:predicted TIM-barrel fold metal-dependent hydrolase
MPVRRCLSGLQGPGAPLAVGVARNAGGLQPGSRFLRRLFCREYEAVRGHVAMRSWPANMMMMTMKIPTLAAVSGSLLFLSHPSTAQDPTVDLHVHLRNGAASIDEYEAQVRSAKRQVTAFGGMWFGGPHQALQGDVEHTRAQNDALIALASRHPRMVPIATVHPYDGQAALEELERVAGRGVKVVKLHPHTQRFDVADSRLLKLVQQAGALGVVVLMDNANVIAGDSENLFNLAVRAPKTKFVFAHMGGLNFRFWNTLALARTADDFFMDNIYFDISGTVVLAADSPIEQEFVWTLRNIGIDHVLLGSDYPQFSLAQTLDALERLDLDAGEKARIRYRNALRLLGK